MQRFNTIRIRFSFWTAGLLFAMLLIFGVFIYTSMGSELASAIDDSLQLSAAQAIAAAVDDGQISVSDSVPEPLAFAALDDRGYTIRILNTDGAVLGAFGLYRDLPIADSDVVAAGKQEELFSTVMEPINQEPIRFYTAPVLANDQVIAIIQVAQSLDIVNDTMEHLLTLLLVIVPLLVGLTAVGSYALASSTLAPIDAITRKAQQISAQDLHERLNLPETPDEVGRLAVTFDMMLSRLQEAFQRERQFTADASHELRTPLTAMQTIIAVTRERRRSPEEYEQVLDDFNGITRGLHRLVDELLQVARGDHPTPIVSDRVDLSLLLEDVVAVIAPLIETKQLILQDDIAAGLIVRGDNDNLVRLFVNLLENAVKYTDTGTITIQATAVHNLIQVRIADTGMGIREEDLPYVFDRFYRVDASRTTPGSGLGLSIAQTIAIAHQGIIEVSSEFGRGTTIMVTLPANEYEL